MWAIDGVHDISFQFFSFQGIFSWVGPCGTHIISIIIASFCHSNKAWKQIKCSLTTFWLMTVLQLYKIKACLLWHIPKMHYTQDTVMPNQNTIQNIYDLILPLNNVSLSTYPSISLIDSFLIKILVCLIFIRSSIYLGNLVITRCT